MTRPEQSNPRGSAPPQRYGAPTCANASVTTREALATSAAERTGVDLIGSPVERHPTTISDRPNSAAATTRADVDMALRSVPQRQCRARAWSQRETNGRSHDTLRCAGVLAPWHPVAEWCQRDYRRLRGGLGGDGPGGLDA